MSTPHDQADEIIWNGIPPEPAPKVTNSFDNVVKIATPTLYFQVQMALQANGVQLVDPKSCQPFQGQVHLGRIGLIYVEKQTPQPNRQPMGFQANEYPPAITITSPRKSYARTDIQAVLIYDVSKTDPKKRPIMMIKVLNNQETTFWAKMGYGVGQKLAEVLKLDESPVLFVIGGVFEPIEKELLPEDVLNQLILE